MKGLNGLVRLALLVVLGCPACACGDRHEAPAPRAATPTP